MTEGMTAGPSIKGSLFEAVVADVNALVAAGRITREELEARLEAADLPYLEEKIGAGFWYPIETYRRLLETLRDVEGGARANAYLRERGATAARRLIEGGLYRQMDASVDTWGERVGRIMVTLAPVIFNFGAWSCSTEGGEIRLEAREVAPLPEVSRIVIEGFVSVMATRALKAEVEIRSTRPAPDRILFERRRA
jgi:hypothetical protein